MALLTPSEIQKIEEKISALETLTSAEFKIIICKRAWFGLRKKAMKLFRKYNLHKTQERNAVLLLIVEQDRQILIYGDEGIHCKTGTKRWVLIKTRILNYFKAGDYYSGISVGLHLIADSLIENFPANSSSGNEVSNDIIFE